jgi:RNA polymerase sigma-32 factor
MDMIKTDDNIEEMVAAKERREILAKKISDFKTMLNDKELFIFEHRIMVEEPLTLQGIGEQFKISRERVRQLENRVIKKFSDKFELEFRKLDL